MKRLFRVDDATVRRVRITPQGGKRCPEYLAFAHDSCRIPVERLVLAGWPEYVRTESELDCLKHQGLNRKTFREWYKTLASQYDDDVIFVIGRQATDTQARPNLVYPIIPFRIVDGKHDEREYEPNGNVSSYYDSETGNVVYYPTDLLSFQTNFPSSERREINHEDLLLIGEPTMLRVVRGRSLEELGLRCEEDWTKFWVQFLRDNISCDDEAEEGGYLKKVVGVIGRGGGDSLHFYTPLVRFEYQPTR